MISGKFLSEKFSDRIRVWWVAIYRATLLKKLEAIKQVIFNQYCEIKSRKSQILPQTILDDYFINKKCETNFRTNLLLFGAFLQSLTFCVSGFSFRFENYMNEWINQLAVFAEKLYFLFYIGLIHDYLWSSL